MSVARDWEVTLRSWVKPPSDNEDAKRNETEAEIKEALRASEERKLQGLCEGILCE